jgi:3',5'-nucleoside bisphosphate phosphatase
MSSSHTSRGPGGGLLCELHAHSRWSDGELELHDVVDLYGRAGFDVLCITDHVVRDGGMVSAGAFPAYRLAIAEQTLRAWERYRMVVIPGLELTWDDPDDCRAAHAVVIGTDRFVGLEDGLDAALEIARDRGAAIIAGHPHGIGGDAMPGRTTRRWWLDGGLRSLAHRFELINRTQVFEWGQPRASPRSQVVIFTARHISARGRRCFPPSATRPRWSSTCGRGHPP